MILSNSNIEVENTSKSTTVSDDALSRLRYFLNCMISVVPDLNENDKLGPIISEVDWKFIL